MSTWRTVALFTTDEYKTVDVGNFHDRDYGRIGTINKKFPLEISYCMTEEEPRKIGVRVYYSGDGNHPFGGNTYDIEVEKEVFTKLENSLEYLTDVVLEYGPVELKYVTDKVCDTWNGKTVIFTCKEVWSFITEDLKETVGFDYSDYFKGIKNFKDKPAATPLYILEERLSMYELLHGRDKKWSGVSDWKFDFGKKGENRARIELAFFDSDRGFGQSALENTKERYLKFFEEMKQYNYCFGNCIPEIKRLAKVVGLSKSDMEYLFPSSCQMISDTVEFIKDANLENLEKYGVDDHEPGRYEKALAKIDKIEGPLHGYNIDITRSLLKS